MTTYIPAKYLDLVRAAAKASGLTVAIVAAQINEESGFNPNAVSPTNAQGIAQFEPGTWVTWGHGSPFDPVDAFPAYAAFMHYLLGLFGGSVRDALAGYNAGPGNIQAGMGYADTILAAAGAGYGTTASGGTDSGNINLSDIQVTGAAAIDQIARQIAREAQNLIGARLAMRRIGTIGWRP